MVNDKFFLSLALKEAWKYQGLTYPNPPVGAVITDKNNQIISIAAHKKQGLPHAELECTKKAYLHLTNDKKIDNIKDANTLHTYLLKKHNNIFNDCKIYVTLEPCNHQGSTPPCSLLLSSLHFKEVIIGSTEKNKIAKGGIKTLKNHNIKVTTRCLEKECDMLIEPFLKWQKDRFIFFKIAQNLNGTYNTGIISSNKSREFTHKLREKIDLLVIGGNTVRMDRPTLDSRMVGIKAPDVLIYSKQKEFDKTISLFNIKNRKVFIEDNLELIKKYNYIMIEGGNNMLKATKHLVDWYLFFIAPNIKKGETLNIDLKLQNIHCNPIDKDLMCWLRHSYLD